MATLALDGGAPQRKDFLIFGRPCLGEEEIEAVVATLRSGWIGTGPRAQELERDFAAAVQAPRAVAVSSCTAALHLALLVSGVEPGDEVITSTYTFTATANAILHCGARPVFVDIDEETLNLRPDQVADAVTPKTKAILPVHFGGLPVDLDALRSAAEGRVIVEDAAHAVGAVHAGRPIGGHGNLACFSFYANKNLTTAEGGMITCTDEETAARLACLRLHGMSQDAWRRYSSRGGLHCPVVEVGYKYNLPDLLAALGVVQLRRLEDFLQHREALARRYDSVVDALPGLRRQARPAGPGTRHGLQLSVVILDPAQFRADRDQVVTALRAENIGAGIHYTPLHQEPCYRALLSLPDGTFPVAEAVEANCFSLPLTPGMSPADADDVTAALTKVLEHYRR